MKILFCTPTFQRITHGPAKFAQFVSQINELYPVHEIKILTEDYEGGGATNICNINIYCPRLFHSFMHFFRAFQYHRKAIELRDEFPFDLLVYNNAIIGIWSALRWGKNIPVIGLLNDDENLRMSWVPDPEKPFRKWIIRLFFKYFERISARKLRATIVCSNFLREEAIKSYETSPSKTFRLYQTVDIDQFKFQTRDPRDFNQPIKILFVKSDFQRGGFWVLLQALEKLESYLFELIIIGPSLSNEKNILRRTNEVLNIRTTFLGPQSQKVVRTYLQQSDILCIPSFRESLGVANIEGLAAGIHVVSTRVGGIPEVLGNGKYGWLAEPENTDSLASCIEMCLNNPEERNRKARAGRKFVEQQFSHKIMLDNFVSILEAVKAEA